MARTLVKTAARLCLLMAWSFALQAAPRQMQVAEADLRAAASVYPAPEYPAASVQANHSGRVVVQVTVAPTGKQNPFVRVQSTKVVEAPDTEMANAVLEALKEVRYMPFFDDKGQVVEATGVVVWEFRITAGKPEVIDPHAVKKPEKTPAQIAADDLRIIQRARQILSSEAVWNRDDNRQCPPNRKTVSLYCALEKATQEVTGGFEHRGTVMEDVRSVIDEMAPPHADYQHRLMGYNNDPATSFADLQKVLQAAEERIAKRAASH